MVELENQTLIQAPDKSSFKDISEASSGKKEPFTDLTNSMDHQHFKRREKFAVSLRKQKKKVILTKKRQNLAQRQFLDFKVATNFNLSRFDDLHPAFADRFTTIVSTTHFRQSLTLYLMLLLGRQAQTAHADNEGLFQ